ncbi:hypothetical protein PILCRDRAFT_435591 [Piloderma croceum F 1598]|uniref:C2 domain-containing protein n=1 Tax=Piloderma croceum (strain F 1598) TaxID=765440 RepID=A0A0C3FUW2_PILCF|nr:hypothetical protein PILCRDRAFT_435591 [Piloderma croceum F 1598]
MNQDSSDRLPAGIPYRSQRTTASSFTTPYEQTFTSSKCLNRPMASPGHQTSMAVTILEAVDLPMGNFRPKIFTEIVSGDLHRRTKSIKQNNDGPTRWDTKFSLCVFIHMAYLSH